jgi:plastocyanin
LPTHGFREAFGLIADCTLREIKRAGLALHAMRKYLAVPLFLALGGPAFAADPAHTIVQKDRTFRPSEVAINHGESLTFTNNDQFLHQIYVVGLFDSEEKSPGENLTESFPQGGTFEVHCHIHPKMKLTVRVR